MEDFGVTYTSLNLTHPDVDALFDDADGLYFSKDQILIAGDFDKALPSEVYAKRYYELYRALQENRESFILRPL